MAPELILKQAEILVFLDALGLSRLPGIDTGRLIPLSPELRRSMLLAGVSSLISKGVLVKQDEIHVLPSNLVELVRFIGTPEVLVICQKDTPGLGTQTFLLYLSRGRCVELTFPNSDTYRFTEIPSPEAVILRLMEIFPLQSEVMPGEGLQLSMSEFNRFMDMAEEKSKPGIAELIDHAVLAAELARTGLLEAFRRPRFSGKLTVLQMGGSEAVHARDFMCVQGRQTAWLFTLDPADTSQVLIDPVTPETCSVHLSKALAELL